MSEKKDEAPPVSKYPASRVRDDMDDETWHRIRDEEQKALRRIHPER